MSNSHKVNLNFKEIKALLFKRKYCKICNNKLIKINEKNITNNTKIRASTLNITFYGDETELTIRYKCLSCGRIYKLEDL